MNILEYDFGSYNENITAYMKELTQNSAKNFMDQLRTGEIANKQELESLNDCISNVKEYLYYIYIKRPGAFSHAFNSIEKNVRTIAVLPSNMRGIYGYTEFESKKIHINPNFTDSQCLNSEERMRLYVAHELGHVINRDWLIKASGFANQQIRQGKLQLDQAQLFVDGFAMLDEATAQNRAENFTYEFSRKQRPRMLNYRNGRLFNGEVYKSNFDYYGELQEPSIMFARTLSVPDEARRDTESLDMLSERAMYPDFFDYVLDEQSRFGQVHNFIKAAQYMGGLKRASYANFGKGDVRYLHNSKRFLVELKNLTSKMRNRRKEFDDDNR